MSRWLLTVDIDEERLISSNPSEGEEQEEEIEGHISREMGWVQDSGIYLEEIKKLEE